MDEDDPVRRMRRVDETNRLVQEPAEELRRDAPDDRTPRKAAHRAELGHPLASDRRVPAGADDRIERHPQPLLHEVPLADALRDQRLVVLDGRPQPVREQPVSGRRLDGQLVGDLHVVGIRAIEEPDEEGLDSERLFDSRAAVLEHEAKRRETVDLHEVVDAEPSHTPVDDIGEPVERHVVEDLFRSSAGLAGGDGHVHDRAHDPQGKVAERLELEQLFEVPEREPLEPAVRLAEAGKALDEPPELTKRERQGLGDGRSEGRAEGFVRVAGERGHSPTAPSPASSTPVPSTPIRRRPAPTSSSSRLEVPRVPASSAGVVAAGAGLELRGVGGATPRPSVSGPNGSSWCGSRRHHVVPIENVSSSASTTSSAAVRGRLSTKSDWSKKRKYVKPSMPASRARRICFRAVSGSESSYGPSSGRGSGSWPGKYGTKVSISSHSSSPARQLAECQPGYV